MLAAYRYMNDDGCTTSSAVYVYISSQRSDPCMHTAQTDTLMSSSRKPDAIIFYHNFEVSRAEEHLYGGFRCLCMPDNVVREFHDNAIKQ